MCLLILALGDKDGVGPYTRTPCPLFVFPGAVDRTCQLGAARTLVPGVGLGADGALGVHSTSSGDLDLRIEVVFLLHRGQRLLGWSHCEIINS